jgi:hypothetical protein
MKSLLTLSLLFCVLLNVEAQNELKPVLKNSDIDRFIETYEPMVAELEMLDDSMEDEGDMEEMTYEAVLSSFEDGLDDNEAVAIIEKYGWDKSTYGKKMMAIGIGASYLIILKHVDQMPEEQGKAMIEMYTKQYKMLVHDDDLETLKPRIHELEQFFGEE